MYKEHNPVKEEPAEETKSEERRMLRNKKEEGKLVDDSKKEEGQQMLHIKKEGTHYGNIKIDPAESSKKEAHYYYEAEIKLEHEKKRKLDT